VTLLTLNAPYKKGIICAADDTIEPPKTMLNEQGQNIRFIDGVGQIIHQCHDPAPLWHAVRESDARPYDEGVLDNTFRVGDLPTGTEYFEIPEIYFAG
jgi:hypothetical protein